MDLKNKWICKELEEVSLGDKRLNKRIIELASNISKGPGLPLNQVSDDWSAVKASYRLFDNNKITPDKILEPHIDKTVKRAQEYPYIFIIQDTSVVDFSTHQKTKGVGSVGGQTKVKHRTQGIIMHTSLALSPNGVPLGLK